MKNSVYKVAGSTMVLLAENLVRLTAVAAVSFWIARELGPEQFGILNSASAFMAIMLVITTLGMETPLVLRLSQTKHTGVVMGTAILMRSIFSVAIFSLAVGIAHILKANDALSLNVTVIVLLCIIAYVPNVLDIWFKAETSAVGPALARTTATLLSAAAKVVCLLLGLEVMALAWTIFLESVLTGFGLYIAYRWSNKGTHLALLSADRRLIPDFLRESAPYLWSSIAVILYMKVDVVMLSYFSTNTETGIYSLAQKLSEVLYVVPVVLVDSSFSLLSKAFIESEKQTHRHGQLLFDISVGGAVISTLIALFVAGPLVSRIFGDEYQPSINIFYVHAWSCVAIALNTARNRWLAVVALQKYAPAITGLGLILNVVMNLALIPSMGALGAAISTVVSYFISGYISSFFFLELRGIGKMQTRALWPWHRLYIVFRNSR